MITFKIILNNEIKKYEIKYFLLINDNKEFSIFPNHKEIFYLLINAKCKILINKEDINNQEYVLFENKNGFLTFNNNQATCLIEK